jgi:TolA-binding protein
VNYSALISSNSSSRFIPYALSKRASCYYNLKDYGKTAQDYITILQNYATHPISNDVLLPLQEALNLSGRASEFDQYLAGFKTANPEAKGIESVEFESVKSLYFNQDYTKAITGLSRYVSSYPESPRLTEAKYYQAESHYRLKDLPKALEIYYAIYPEKSFAFASKVTARIAEIEYKSGRYEKSLPVFHHLARLAANKKEQYTAWNGLMESHYYLAQYDSAIAYANIILEKGNINAGAQNKASLFIGKAQMAKGDYETAKDEFLNTLNSAQDEYGAEAKYLLGEIFFLTREHKQCYENLVSLTTDFEAYPEWVGKAFILLSDNYAAQGDMYQAKATLKSLDEFPLQTIKDQAKDKLAKLNQQDLKKAPAKNDSIDNEKK